MTRPRVLITRPDPGAAVTAGRLAARGFEPVLLPLSEIRAISGDIPYGAFDAVAATSANAPRHASSGLVAALSGLTLFAVGPETARAAEQAGFAFVVSGTGDALALADIIAEKLPRGGRIAYLTGEVRLEAFEVRLAQAGLEAVAIATYDTLPTHWTDAALLTALGREPIDAVLLHSALGADAALALAGRSALFEKSLFFCLSARIADRLPQALSGRVFAATKPSDEVLMDMLTQECMNPP